METREIGATIAKPPEMMAKNSHEMYDNKIDVWYIGMMALLLFSKNFNSLKDNRDAWVLEVDQKQDEEAKELNMHNISLECIRFIQSSLRYDFKRRPTALELLNDDYFTADLSNCITLGQILERRYQ